MSKIEVNKWQRLKWELKWLPRDVYYELNSPKVRLFAERSLLITGGVLIGLGATINLILIPYGIAAILIGRLISYD